jgi:N-acetylneuraminate synthase
MMWKIASASLTDNLIINKMKKTGRPIMLSTGMSSMEEVEEAVELIGKDNLLLAQSTSTYPCKLEELNLNVIKTYK